jgi:hypothetical protein
LVPWGADSFLDFALHLGRCVTLFAGAADLLVLADDVDAATIEVPAGNDMDFVVVGIAFVAVDVIARRAVPSRLTFGR